MSPEFSLVLDKISTALAKSSREIEDITLVAVSKGQSCQHLEEWIAQNTNFPLIFGENYLDELSSKQAHFLNTTRSQIDWHYLGNLQSRKIPELKKKVSTLHGVYREKELEAMADLKTGHCPKFYLQYQVDFNSQEKVGLTSTEELQSRLELINKLGIRHKFLGLMTMASPLELVGELKLREEYAHVRKIRDSLLPGFCLSMGTSEDYTIAIEEGSTCVRLGTVLFGARKKV